MNSMKAWVGALMGGAIVCAVSDVGATEILPDTTDALPYAIPGAAVGSFGIAAVASLIAYHDEPGELAPMGYAAGALTGVTSVVYFSMAGLMEEDLDGALPVFLPTGAVNLALAAACFGVAATSGGDEAPPVTPIVTSDGSHWQAGMAGTF